MSFKKPTSKKVKTDLTVIAGATGGVMLARVIADNVAKPAIETAPTEAEANTKLMVKGGLVAAGTAGLMFIDGDDTVSLLLKGISLGVAAISAVDLVGGLVKKSPAASNVVNAQTTSGTLMRSALGLGCPCQTTQLQRPMLNRPALKRPALRNPEFPVRELSFNEMVKMNGDVLMAS